jgi:hypothetical protein
VSEDGVSIAHTTTKPSLLIAYVYKNAQHLVKNEPYIVFFSLWVL